MGLADIPFYTDPYVYVKQIGFATAIVREQINLSTSQNNEGIHEYQSLRAAHKDPVPPQLSYPYK